MNQVESTAICSTVPPLAEHVGVVIDLLHAPWNVALTVGSVTAS
jgi:hypothetical protein